MQNGDGNQMRRHKIAALQGRQSAAQIQIDVGELFGGIYPVDECNLVVLNVSNFSGDIEGQAASINKEPSGSAGGNIAFHNGANSIPADVPADAVNDEFVRGELDSETSRLADRTVLEWTVLGQDSRSSRLAARLLSAIRVGDFSAPAKLCTQRMN